MQNLHTHTTLSDGINTPREMVERALELGFNSIGFSDHAKTEFDIEIEADTDKYIKTINALKDEYEGKIDIFLGIELDYYSKGLVDLNKFDYTIGSVHYSKGRGDLNKSASKKSTVHTSKANDKNPIYFDHSPEFAQSAIKNEFSNNSMEYAREYYEKVIDMSSRFDFDIVGHFDVLTKYTEKIDGFLDTGSTVYRTLALDALHTVRKKHELFELNTGAIGRGWRTTPYPEKFILKEMHALDCKMILSSDCHNGKYLSCHFDQARELLKATGFTEIYRLTKNGFIGEKI